MGQVPRPGTDCVVKDRDLPVTIRSMSEDACQSPRTREPKSSTVRSGSCYCSQVAIYTARGAQAWDSCHSVQAQMAERVYRLWELGFLRDVRQLAFFVTINKGLLKVKQDFQCIP